MPDIPPEIQDKLTAISSQIEALTAQVASIKTEAIGAAREAVQAALAPLQAQVQFSAVVEAAIDKLDQDDPTQEGISREQLTQALVKLASSNLQVYILSKQGHALDNVHWATNKGDGDRTVQFQDFDANNDHLKMRLKLV